MSEALQLEKALQGAGLEAKMIQVPRSLGASCGYAVESNALSSEHIDQIAREKKIETAATYHIVQEGHNMNYIACE